MSDAVNIGSSPFIAIKRKTQISHTILNSYATKATNDEYDPSSIRYVHSRMAYKEHVHSVVNARINCDSVSRIDRAQIESRPSPNIVVKLCEMFKLFTGFHSLDPNRLAIFVERTRNHSLESV